MVLGVLVNHIQKRDGSPRIIRNDAVSLPSFAQETETILTLINR